MSIPSNVQSNADSLGLPEGSVTAQTVDLVNDFPPTRHEVEETLVDIAAPFSQQESDTQTLLPWWKRPSPVWILVILPITTIAYAATMAPRVAIYTELVCAVHKPELRLPESTVFSSIIQGNGSRCAEDPLVNAEVAKLTVAMTTSMGILSCITTAWWGSFSDRHGRARVLGISVIGLLITDVNFIQVLFNFRRLPGGYWFLIIGPIVEGSLGGVTSAIAAIHAYLADTSSPETRSRVFSLSLGLMFIGFAVGPTIGSLIIRLTHSTISIFYAAAFLHFLYALAMWFLLPESVTLRQRQESAAKYEEEIQLAQEYRASSASNVYVTIKRAFAFLYPLAIFSPRVSSHGGNPLKDRKDWGLTLLALSYGFTVSIMGSYSYKFQYAGKVFHWTPEIIGYWLSLVSITRAVFLAAILPVLIKLFKRKPPATAHQPNEQEPLLPGRQKQNHSAYFDLNLARVSLVVELISYTLMALVITPGVFTILSMASALGTGFSPAIQSVALELYASQGGTETGKLFGALSVVQSLSSQIIGPAIYGFVYMKTVSTFPRAIFLVTVSTLLISTVLILLIKLPAHHALDVESLSRRDATLVESEGAETDVSTRKLPTVASPRT